MPKFKDFRVDRGYLESAFSYIFNILINYCLRSEVGWRTIARPLPYEILRVHQGIVLGPKLLKLLSNIIPKQFIINRFDSAAPNNIFIVIFHRLY